jgi:hypothetical protein
LTLQLEPLQKLVCTLKAQSNPQNSYFKIAFLLSLQCLLNSCLTVVGMAWHGMAPHGNGVALQVGRAGGTKPEALVRNDAISPHKMPAL